MAPRAFGALSALVAALLFATALAGGLVPSLVPGWWDGHPIVDGKVRELKVIHVGLLEASGCNLGEQVVCEPLDLGHHLEPVSYGELGALGLGSLTMLLLAMSAWKLGDRRKFLGKLALFEVVVIGGGAAAIFFVRGPDLNVQIRLGLPVGIGLFAAVGGCGVGLIASVIGMRLEPEPLRLKSSEARMPHPQQHQPAFDVRELLRDSQQRIAPMPPSPGGPLAGPSGPLGGPMSAPSGGHVHGAQPLFETAPQLRPLYDLHNAGAQPSPLAPPLPSRAPTPMPADQVRNILGFPTPPPLEAVTPPTRGTYDDPGDSASAHVPVSAFGAEPYVPASPPRSIEHTEDIPRERDSYDPMPPGFGAAAPGSFGAQPPQPFVEPTTPPNRHSRPGTNVRKAAAAVGGPARANRPSVPPRVTGSHRPTISAPVPPMPSQHAEPAEPRTNVEIDAEAKARAQDARERPSEQAMTMPVERKSFDHTDESVIAPPLPRGDYPTDENAFVPPGESTAETRAPESFEELETRDAKKFTEEELAAARTEIGPFGGPPPRADSELPTKASPKVDLELPTVPARDAPVVIDALARGESPARAEREAAPPAPDQTLDRDDDIVPPPKPAGPPPPPPGRQRRVSGAPAPMNAAAVPVASFAIAPSAANPLPSVRSKPTEPPAPLQPKSAAEPSAPPEQAPTAPPVHSGPTPSVPAQPIASMPKGALPSIAKPNVPLPRILKPSVPPPSSKFSGISTKNPVEPKAPFMPSNLAAAASANKASTSNTPSPFATIPSPFAKQASTATHEAVTRPAPSHAANEAPTVTSAKPGLDAKLGEAPTVPARFGAAEPDSNEGATVKKTEPAVRQPEGKSAVAKELAAAKAEPPARPTPLPRATPQPPAASPAPSTRSTGANVPISTAPSSLPPPKQAP
ncbi:MAG TPA: hypothetical protein VFQ65_26215, partial [Kofleriaceae bacterium]|nr:hypothetical protein [Kofleriaceae bacterium]